MGSICEPLGSAKGLAQSPVLLLLYFVSSSPACAPPRESSLSSRTTISFLHSYIQDISQPSEHSRQTKTE